MSIKVSADLKRKISEFGEYVDLELAILQDSGVSYEISGRFLETMLERIGLYLSSNAPSPPIANGGLDYHQKLCISQAVYFSQAGKILERGVGRAGSFWEEVSSKLSLLALQVKRRGEAALAELV